MTVVDDQIGRPTSTSTIAYVIAHYIVGNGFLPGIYNLSNTGDVCSKYELAQFINKEYNFNKNIIPIKTPISKNCAKRQKNSIFKNRKKRMQKEKKKKPSKGFLLVYL
mgnify:CR=1 FL=1